MMLGASWPGSSRSSFSDGQAGESADPMTWLARHSNGLVVGFFVGNPKGLNIDIHTYNHIHVYDYMILYDCICIIPFGDGL